jgi:chromosome partitioning protein
MGSVIVVASSKGGCSKTVTVTALAVNLLAHGYKVAVCDSDPNQAFVRWHKTAGSPPISVSSQMDQNLIVGHLNRLAKIHDVVLCDTGGWSNQTQVFAMGAASMVIIPVMPDRNSIVEAARTAQQVKSVSEIARRDIPYRVLLTRWTPKGLSERAALEDLEASSLPRLQHHIGDLVAFQKSSFSGVMPTKGYIGLIVSRVIDELVGLGAIGPVAAEAAA